MGGADGDLRVLPPEQEDLLLGQEGKNTQGPAQRKRAHITHEHLAGKALNQRNPSPAPMSAPQNTASLPHARNILKQKIKKIG
jgi:hypothetical protein